jgi:hypothetical protein
MKAMFLALASAHTFAAGLGIAPGTASLTSTAQAATVQAPACGRFGRVEPSRE